MASSRSSSGTSATRPPPFGPWGNIFGGRAKSYENELASGVSDALAEMEQQAAQLGADAVVGVDIDYETVGNNMLMVSASGTAVKLG